MGISTNGEKDRKLSNLGIKLLSGTFNLSLNKKHECEEALTLSKWLKRYNKGMKFSKNLTFKGIIGIKPKFNIHCVQEL